MTTRYNHSMGNRWVIPILLLSLITGSCKKLIEIPPNPINQIPQAAVFSDSSDIISAIAGVYLNFKVAGGSNLFSGNIAQSMGLAAGEMTYAYSGNTFQTNTYIATDGTASGFWTSGYTNLYYINSCLEGITSTTAISDALKQALIGELKMVRAMHYFYLVNLYGAVPIVNGTDYKTNTDLARSSVDSVYAFILSDLTDARKVLKATYPSAGRARPNLYTADALLARVYLYLGQYANADVMASEVISSGNYGLTALSGVFLQGSNEAIWQLPAVGTSFQTTDGEFFIPYSNTSAPTYPMTSFLVDSFETGDQRKTAWIGTSTAAGKIYNYPFKYKNRTYSATPVESYMFFRLAEQYLIRAEALARQNKADSALADLNKIRSRAGLGNSTASTPDEILSAILHERQIELFCEWGHRWFDLRRTGRIDAVLGAIKPGWLPTDATLPIPSQEMQNDPYLTQNPGY